VDGFLKWLRHRAKVVALVALAVAILGLPQVLVALVILGLAVYLYYNPEALDF
jgi:hypothetical protein